ncbi:MAG: hypothetical protein EZS28_037057, partial [Streblomastix strix]
YDGELTYIRYIHLVWYIGTHMDTTRWEEIELDMAAKISRPHLSRFLVVGLIAQYCL